MLGEPRTFFIFKNVSCLSLKESKKWDIFIGYTKNIEQRLKEHNSGLVEYTKKYFPWDLIYCESFVSLDDAKNREKTLKAFGKSFTQLKLRVKNSLDMTKIMNKEEGAVNPAPSKNSQNNKNGFD